MGKCPKCHLSVDPEDNVRGYCSILCANGRYGTGHVERRVYDAEETREAYAAVRDAKARFKRVASERNTPAFRLANKRAPEVTDLHFWGGYRKVVRTPEERDRFNALVAGVRPRQRRLS